MGTTRSHVVMLLVGVMLAPSMARAQQPGPQPNSQTLATVAAEHAAKKKERRQAILDVLDREEVRDAAKQAGLQIEKVASTVAMLENEELAHVMEEARHVNDAVAGGQRPWWKPTKRDFLTAVMIVIPMAVILWLLGNGYVL